MTIRRTTVFFLWGLAVIVVPVSAHHSMSAEFDLSRHVTVSGIITGLDWTNPHVWIFLDNQTPGKSDVGWGIEAAPPGALSKRGMIPAALPIGTRITVEGFQTIKPNSRKISGITLTLPDGKQLNIRDSLNWAPLRH